MTRTWFTQDLETVATFLRIARRDGITLGFTTHDQDLWIDGTLHRASPGMVPSSIRKTAGFEADSAEVQGALCHGSITEADLGSGRFDGAQIRIGLVDWQSGKTCVLYGGEIGTVSNEAGSFTAALASSKARLQRDPVPRTSPSCRAAFCGPGCTLSPARFTHERVVQAVDFHRNAVTFTTATDPTLFAGGTVRWRDGPQTGQSMGIMAADDTGALILDQPLEANLAPGTMAVLREGCDHTLDTCATRFANAVNFQGEPYLPGNDLLTRYPVPAA